MAQPTLNVALGRVLIAAAWSDGELSSDERSSLSDLLFRLPDLLVHEWETLRAELDQPIDTQRRQQHVESLFALMNEEEDYERVRQAMAELMDAQTLAPEDQALLESIYGQIEAKESGVFDRVRGLLAESIQRRAQSLTDFFRREQKLKTDARGRILDRVRDRLPDHAHDRELSDDELHKLCLAGGIMARIANADHVVTKGEYSAISEALRSAWELPLERAALVTEIAIDEVTNGLDTYAVVREFFQQTTEDERIRFLDVLFQVAEADGAVTNDEMEEIRLISKGLLLSHKHFIAAKTKVPGKRRQT